MSLFDADLDHLLAKVPAEGSIGNQSLRESLGWTEQRSEAARDALMQAGTLEKGRGRGGSVKRGSAPTGATAAKPLVSATKAPPTAGDDIDSDSAPKPKTPKAKTNTNQTFNLGFEAKLWLAADKLRNNMDAAEYKRVVRSCRAGN